MSLEIKNITQRLGKIDDLEWDKISSLIRTQKIKKGQCFLSVGETSDRFAVVEEGLFRIYYVDQEGKEAIKTFRSRGGVIGAYAEFLRKIPSRLNVEALCDSTISVVQADDVMNLFKSSAAWEKVGRKITELLYLEKEEREYQFLCLDASHRYQAFLKEYAQDLARIPDYMVASYLGITPVYLSKLKKGSGQ